MLRRSERPPVEGQTGIEARETGRQDAIARINRVYQEAGVAPLVLPEIAAGSEDTEEGVNFIKRTADRIMQWWNQEQQDPQAVKRTAEARRRLFNLCAENGVWLFANFDGTTGDQLDIEERTHRVSEAVRIAGVYRDLGMDEEKIARTLSVYFGLSTGPEAQEIARLAHELDRFPPLLDEGGKVLRISEQAAALRHEYQKAKERNTRTQAS